MTTSMGDQATTDARADQPADGSSGQHPAIRRVVETYGDRQLSMSLFRGQSTLIVEPADAHEVLRFLREDPACDCNMLVDVTAVDYLGYPVEQPGRFAVVWVLRSHAHDQLLLMKTFLNPTIETSGIEPDPGLEVDSACDIWPGAEWREREVYDMFGIRFKGHPDLRRILTWRDFPAHPLRKDYPLRGRGERENYSVTERDSV